MSVTVENKITPNRNLTASTAPAAELSRIEVVLPPPTFVLSGPTSLVTRNTPELNISGASAVIGTATAAEASIATAAKPQTNDLYKRYVTSGLSEGVQTEREPEKPGLLSRFVSGAKEFLHSATETTKSAWDGIKSFATNPIESISNGITRFAESIGSSFNKAVAWLSDLASKSGTMSAEAANPKPDGSGFFGTEAKIIGYVVEVARQVAAEAEQKRKVMEETSQVNKRYVSGALEFGNDATVAAKMQDIYATPQEVAAAVSAAREKRDAELLKAAIAQTESQVRGAGTSPDTQRRIQERLGAADGKANHHELLAAEKETIKKESLATTATELVDGTRRAEQLLSSRLAAAGGRAVGAAAQLSDALFRHRDDDGVRELLDNPSAVSKNQMAELMRRLGVQIS